MPFKDVFLIQRWNTNQFCEIPFDYCRVSNLNFKFREIWKPWMFVINDFCVLKQDGGQAQNSRTFECFRRCFCVFSANFCVMLFVKRICPFVHCQWLCELHRTPLKAYVHICKCLCEVKIAGDVICSRILMQSFLKQQIQKKLASSCICGVYFYFHFYFYF